MLSMLSVIMTIVVMLCVIMRNVVLLSVVGALLKSKLKMCEKKYWLLAGFL